MHKRLQMAKQPDLIVLRRHRDLEGRRQERWIRRMLLGVVFLFAAAGLFNVYGQRESNAAETSSAASLEVRAPTAVRGGLIYQVRFVIDARQELKKATLVLDRDWFEGMTLNTLEPSPIGEASRNGAIAFELGHVPAGDKHVLYLQYQVNPTDLGRRTQTVELWDGDRRLLSLRRTLRVFP